MAINFPDSPTLNQVFSAAGRTWKWDGTTWVSVGAELVAADITDLTASATEINYTDGVTSAIQTQINAQIPRSTVTTAGDLIVADGNASVTRLGIGANGTVLTSNGTTANWQAPAGGSQNWQLLATQSMGGAQTRTISGIGGYNELFMTFTVEFATSNYNMIIRPNNDTGSNYIYTRAITNYLNNNPTVPSNFNSSWNPTNSGITVGTSSTNTNSAVNGFLTIRGGNSSGKKIFEGASGGQNMGATDHEQMVIGGVWNNTATITSLTLTTGATSFSTGTFYLYGA